MGEECKSLFRWRKFYSQNQPFWPSKSSKNYGLDKTWTWIWFQFHWKRKSRRHRGKVAHFMQAIACGKGLITVEQYHGRINAERFSSFVREDCLKKLFKKCLEKVLTQGNFFSRMVILHRTVWKPDLSRMRLLVKNVPF